jgi:hypothetical protein
VISTHNSVHHVYRGKKDAYDKNLSRPWRGRFCTKLNWPRSTLERRPCLCVG